MRLIFASRRIGVSHVRKLASSNRFFKEDDVLTVSMDTWFRKPAKKQESSKKWQSSFTTYDRAIQAELEEDRINESREMDQNALKWVHDVPIHERMQMLERADSDDRFISVAENNRNKLDEEVVAPQLDGYYLPTFAAKNGRLKNEQGRIVIYTNGICIGNNHKGTIYRSSGCGIYMGQGLEEAFMTPAKYPDRWTNEWAALFAIEFALRQAKIEKLDFLEVRTSSQFCINGLNGLIDEWTKNAARKGDKIWTHDGQRVKHQAAFQRIDKIRQKINVRFVLVGQMMDKNNDDIGNQAAYRLANKGADIHWDNYHQTWLQPKWTKKFHKLR